MELDFNFFNKWARKKLNIDLDSYKEKQLQRRIATVMRGAGATTLEEYANLISKDEEVRRVFLDYITINVTEFFRNKEIFKEFETLICDLLQPRFKSLKIWSAACSIGSEPYSIAIILDRNNITMKDKILATDIDKNILLRAKNGIYRNYEIKNLDKSILNKYFTYNDDNYMVNDKIRDMVNFKKHDLILDNYEKGFHAVVCRNVTIYLKNEAKDEIYRKVYNSLVSGGVFFIGATETIYNPKDFGFRKLSTFIYEKV